MNRVKIFELARAFLLTAAIGVALKLGDAEIKIGVEASVVEAAKHSHPILEHWPWLVVGLLILFALLVPFLVAWAISFWYWISRRSFTALGVVLSLGAIITVDRFFPLSVWWFGAVLLLVFIYLVRYFCPSDDHAKPTQDRLHRIYFIDRLSAIFQSDRTMLRRVAIIGTWGAGKTTVLELLREKLQGSEEGKYRIAFVNPWKAQTPEEAWAILAKGFDQALGLPSPLSRRWIHHPFLTGLLKLLPLPGISNDLISVFEGSGNASDQSRVDKINRLLEERQVKVVILVDDMERAEPEVIRKMFPVINHLCELRNCFFVFAIDRERVAKAFGKNGDGNDEARGYLDKVFDIQLELPAPLIEDIGEMCEALLDEEECPKLHRCFSELKPVLPTNPRAALKFLNLAKTKETLFLVRYREEEHPYVPFFILWMLETEFPGSIEVLLRPEFKKNLDNLVMFELFESGKDRLKSDDFKALLDALAKKHSESDQSRLRELFEAFTAQTMRSLDRPWLGLSGFHFKWAADEHMRLLELAVEDRTKLEARWKDFAGKESIREMIAKAIPGEPFSDIARCAGQLIEMEAKRIENIVKECYGLKGQEVDEKIREALAATGRLRRHLAYAVDNKLEIELSVFGEELFRSWLEGIFQSPLDPLKAKETDKLRKERNEFNFDLIAQLPIDRCYSLFMSGVARIIDRPGENGSSEAKKHAHELRKRLMMRIAEHVFDLFRNGKIPDDWYKYSVTKRGGMEFLYAPQNWLPVEFPEEGLIQLEEFVEESKSSESVAKNFASLVEKMYTKPLSRGFDRDYLEKRSSILHLLKNGEQNYIQLLWKGAMSPLVDEETRERLLSQRELAIKHGRGEHEPPEETPEHKSFIRDSDVESLFPMNSESSEQEGGEK